MASYYDEHDCVPLGEGEGPNHLLHLARLLMDMGLTEEFESLFQQERTAPPASKKAVEGLPTCYVKVDEAGDLKCPICLVPYDEAEATKQLPCQHKFHPECILPWLQKTNSCPVCRYELPTDDPHYEELKKHKARQKQREHDLETLHDSMFG
ncbi:E3 ubiquitin-protein ligase RNF181-like [Lingula anatina]|uniref:E3 ubiquitin-protein ligase RNF181 n=1 Tax=Lingula anatina TaxID=7574 RepID=A0A1S3HD81_LINAN|nr:E3 ubiquitin-protein ligase RNF181 [Lingula anatina]XP_013387268.1 E3 ubiquitin-protein ligase RNF181-like [Lingula anatina]|eukprot:XP_013383970.1 E3 ubiquitin-protein ligase RNF181 [Lingula anatina]